MEEGKKKRSSLNGSFVTGAIALVFLIIGYEVALFVHKAAVTRIAGYRVCVRGKGGDSSAPSGRSE